MVLHAINLLIINFQKTRGANFDIFGKGTDRNRKITIFFDDIKLFHIYNEGIRYISFSNINNQQFDVDIVLLYINNISFK